uniref:Uncharacterized protein n=1 Tax=Salix viminalis TaxID=40686 RepID=A0A6N2LSJ7_SALVM
MDLILYTTGCGIPATITHCCSSNDSSTKLYNQISYLSLFRVLCVLGLVFCIFYPVEGELECKVTLEKRTSFSFRIKESLGHVEIDLNDVVHNGRMNQKYHLIDSKNGVMHVEIRWSTV